MNTQSIEEFCRTQPLTFMNVKNKIAEEKLHLPSFAESFYGYLTVYDRLPTQNEYMMHYRFANGFKLNKIIPNDNVWQGVLSRGRRAYPSFIRDLHFLHLMKEERLDVKYDLEDDKAGVDHTVNYRGERFYVHCYVDTKRSRMFRDKKNKRHKFNGYHVDVPMNMRGDDTLRIGDFFLYSKAHVYGLVRDMDKILSEDLR